jgi:hypothetical protein
MCPSGVATGVEDDLEAGGRGRPGVGGLWNDRGAVVDGLGGVGRGQVGEGDLVTHARVLLGVVRKSSLAGEKGLLRSRGEGKSAESGKRDKRVQLNKAEHPQPRNSFR